MPRAGRPGRLAQGSSAREGGEAGAAQAMVGRRLQAEVSGQGSTSAGQWQAAAATAALRLRRHSLAGGDHVALAVGPQEEQV